jgi:hypothetical protein
MLQQCCDLFFGSFSVNTASLQIEGIVVQRYLG